ncbi:MAG: phosphate-starvation-inducible PsiE family protein [Actinomycetota bacterium]|nr:phosphate-starvation-inducible PsiE family protein [Actinomycetota bacterium]
MPESVADSTSRTSLSRRRHIDAGLSLIEDIVYVGIALFLLASAAVLLYVAGDELFDFFDDSTQTPVIEVLDTLLLLFIVVELLSAVRVTITRRELVAEPFLLVGIIASIKEIVVLSVKAAEEVGTGARFRDQMWEIGVLGAIVLLLGITAWLLRVKEREPDEGHTADEGSD